MQKNKKINLTVKLIALIICLYGIFGQILDNGIFEPKNLAYFTIISNIFGAAYLVIAIINILEDKETLPFFHGMVIFGLTVTMIVFWSLLAPILEPQALLTANNTAVHLFVPLLLILDWLLFSTKGLWRKRDAAWWLLYPVSYYLMTFVMAAAGMRFHNNTSSYPYPFLDIDLLGWHSVMLFVIFGFVGFAAISFSLYFIDHKLGKRNRE